MANTKEFPNVGDTITVHNCNTAFTQYDGKNWIGTQRKRGGYPLTMKVRAAKWAGGGNNYDGNFPPGWYVTAAIIETGELVHFYRKDTGFFGENITVAPGDIIVTEAGAVTKEKRAARIAEIDAEIARLTAEKTCLLDP